MQCVWNKYLWDKPDCVCVCVSVSVRGRLRLHLHNSISPENREDFAFQKDSAFTRHHFWNYSLSPILAKRIENAIASMPGTSWSITTAVVQQIYVGGRTINSILCGANKTGRTENIFCCCSGKFTVLVLEKGWQGRNRHHVNGPSAATLALQPADTPTSLMAPYRARAGTSWRQIRKLHWYEPKCWRKIKQRTSRMAINQERRCRSGSPEGRDTYNSNVLAGILNVDLIDWPACAPTTPRWRLRPDVQLCWCLPEEEGL